MKIRKHTNKPVMRAATRFQPWDFGLMLDIELQCLEQMAEYFETSDIAEGNPRRAKECRLMAKLLTIANGEGINYFELPEYELVPHGICKRLEFKGEGKMKKHVNINNAYRFLQHYKDCPVMRSALREQKAWYLYNRMRWQYLRGCWD